MLQRLGQRAGHHEPECAQIFRDGAELYHGDITQLWDQCYESNRQLLSGLREDSNAAELHALTQKDAALGRMSSPALANSVVLDNVSTS